MSANTRRPLVLASLLAAAAAATAQVNNNICSLQTAVVTTCVPHTTTPACDADCPTPRVLAGPPGGPATTPGPITVAVGMPRLRGGDCEACVHTAVWTTAYPAFCATGLADQVYVVRDLYAGASAPPLLAATPDVPLGFTAAVRTCASGCGPAPVVATLTFPATGCPYVGGLSAAPTPAPGGAAPYAVSPAAAPAAPGPSGGAVVPAAQVPAAAGVPAGISPAAAAAGTAPAAAAAAAAGNPAPETNDETPAPASGPAAQTTPSTAAQAPQPTGTTYAQASGAGRAVVAAATSLLLGMAMVLLGSFLVLLQ